MILAAILSIGNEILEGSIVDTNSTYIAEKLSRLGIELVEIKAVPDDLEKLSEIFKESAKKYDLVITTGGLGPTFDDITAEALALGTDQEVVFNIPAFDHIKSCLLPRKVEMKESHKRQAYLPANSILFGNEKGTALGFGVSSKACLIISMPGIPYEMKHMFSKFVISHIKSNFQLETKYFKELRFTGLPESDLDEEILKLNFDKEIDCIINVSNGEIIVRLRSFNEQLLNSASAKVKAVLLSFFIGFDNDTLEVSLVRTLGERGLTIGVAESCTGGLIGAKITSVPGSSSVFRGGFLVYSNEVKINLLDIDKSIIIQHGAVSKECAKMMAVNTCKLLDVDCAISITGIAGPDGGTVGKPVGLVYIGICIQGEVTVYQFDFKGDRNSVRERSAKTAMDILIKKVRKS